MISEQLLHQDKRKEIIIDFIKFCKIELNLSSLPRFTFSNRENTPEELKSFGYFDPENYSIFVYIKNRNLADILRTLSHELTHAKQFQDNRIKYDSGETGSPIENEANASAGIILRKFGKIRPEIYE